MDKESLVLGLVLDLGTEFGLALALALALGLGSVGLENLRKNLAGRCDLPSG